MGGGGKNSTTTSQVTIPPEVLERYTAVNKRAEEVASNPFQKYGETAEAFVAPINEQQLSGIANVNAAAGAYQPYFDRAALTFGEGLKSAQPGGLNVNEYMNPFQQQVIDATLRQMGQANEQAQSGALGTAVSSGAFGGDRAGIAAANLANQQGMAMGSTLAGLNAQNYQQALATAQQQQGLALGATQADLERLMRGGQFYAGLGTAAQTAGLQGAEAQINAGTLQQQTEQAGKTALVNQFMQEQGYPFQVAQFLANIAMGTGALSGSTTTTTQPAPFFSDRRLKEDVKRIGKTDDGLPIYSFKYKGDDAEQTHVGFMADEVEKVKPEAVGLHPSGYKTVDYAKATENSMGGGVMPSRAGQGFAGGGVAGPYGASPGSQVDFGGYVPQAFLPVGELMVADPAIIDAARQSMAQQLATVANIGEKVRSLDETWQWAKDRWGGEGREDELKSAEAGRGVTYASGGAAYLRSQPPGGLMPNSARSYLSDTLESQDKGDKPELKTASGNGGGSGKSPAENIADLGKMAMMFLGFQNGGRVGYAVGGVETAEERMRRLRGMEPGAATNLLPSGVVPQADRLDRPVSYEVQRPEWTPIVAKSGLSPRAYEYDANTGMVRDSATNQYITNEATASRNKLAGIDISRDSSLDAARDQIATQQLADRQKIETEARNAQSMYERAAAAARAAGSSQPASEQFPELFSRANDARAAADAAMSAPLVSNTLYVPPSELAMREALVSRGGGGADYMPATPPSLSGVGGGGADYMPVSMSGSGGGGADRMPVYDPFSGTGGGGADRIPAVGDLIPAAGTPLAPSGGLVPAAGTPLSFSLMSTSPRPVARPAGLGAAAAAAEATEKPLALVSPSAGERRDGTAYDTASASEFFRTRIINQESGGRQFDENGNPLRSPAGAIGVAQVMEGTGPEAAALAGLEWDRDRWLNDPEYNAAIGEAYFLEMYRRFGSIDKAAAAYNAGPGALASAMDRATALGGSYLDYLPRETQNYVAATTGAGGLGGAGVSERARDGLGRALLTSDKPYEDRTTLGKMFYNEDGTVNRNALLSIASGIGGMLSSPSQFFLPSLGLGLQGAASTYAGLEKQAADIALTKEEARRTNILADKDRIYEGPSGLMFINLGGGMPPVEIWDYLENPSAYSTGDRQLDAEILRQAQIASANAPRAEGVFADPGVQTLLKRETENAERNPASARAQSDAIESAVGASASALQSSIPSLLSQSGAVSAVTNPEEFIRSGYLGGMRQMAASALNDIAATINQMTGSSLPTINLTDGSNAVAAAEIVRKAAVENGMASASGIQELQTILAANPNETLSAEANATLMANLMIGGRRDVRLFDFMRDYKAQPNNPRRTVIDAGQAFQQEYGDQINAEKAALKELIHYGSQPMPPEWAAILGDYKTPMEFLMTPGIPVEAKNEFIAKLLPVLGVNDVVISALQGPDGMYIGNYFGG